MSRGRVFDFLCILALAWGLLSPVAAEAQLSLKLPPQSTPELEQLLRRGTELETERRWGEALTLYEEAGRNLPQQPALEERLELARIHYDVARRYADSSFRKTLLSLNEAESLELYNQVLSRVLAHYVNQPNWQELIQRGTRGLLIAVSEPQFVEYHLRGREEEGLAKFRDEIWQLSKRPIRDRAEAQNAVSQIARLANNRLALPPTAVILEYTCGAIAALDEYSSFLTGAQLTDLYAQIDGNFVGLGVELKAVGNQLAIVSVIPGSPAERGGIRKGDRILSVDGQTTAALSTDKAADLLQGAEGSTVQLIVQTGLEPGRRIVVRREQVEVPSIENARILELPSGTAYLKLVAFQKTTGADLDRALWQLHRGGMKSLIIDLRGNPGGLLTASVEAADRFLEGGTIVSTRGRNPQEDFTYTAHQAGTWSMPLVVLIDGDSASASEIFAGAMRDYRRATLIGVRSFGKGSVQGIFPLNIGNTGIRLTTAKFYSPAGKPFSKVGVEPTIEVRVAAKPLLPETLVASPANGLTIAARQPAVLATPAEQQAESADDPVLAAALQVTRKSVAAR